MPKIRQMAGMARVIFHPRDQPAGGDMATKEKSKQDGELSEQQLDKVAGGQEVRKMETIVVTAKRLPPEPKVVKMETIVVTAQRDRPDLAGTKLAQADANKKKN
jgi:hypothetical protein